MLKAGLALAAALMLASPRAGLAAAAAEPPLPSVKAFRAFRGGLEGVVTGGRWTAPTLFLALGDWDRRRSSLQPDHARVLRLVLGLTGPESGALQAALDRSSIPEPAKRRIIELASASASLFNRAGALDPQVHAWIEAKRAEALRPEAGEAPAPPGLGPTRPEVERARRIARFDADFKPEAAASAVPEPPPQPAGPEEPVSERPSPPAAETAPASVSARTASVGERALAPSARRGALFDSNLVAIWLSRQPAARSASRAAAEQALESALLVRRNDAEVQRTLGGASDFFQAAVLILKKPYRLGWTNLARAADALVAERVRGDSGAPEVRDVVLNDAALRDALSGRIGPSSSGLESALELQLPASAVRARTRARAYYRRAGALGAAVSSLFGLWFFSSLQWPAALAASAAAAACVFLILYVAGLPGALSLPRADAQALRRYLEAGRALGHGPAAAKVEPVEAALLPAGSSRAALDLASAHGELAAALEAMQDDPRVARARGRGVPPFQVAVALMKSKRLPSDDYSWNMLLGKAAALAEAVVREGPELTEVRDVVLNDDALRKVLSEAVPEYASLQRLLNRHVPERAVKAWAQVRLSRIRAAVVTIVPPLLMGSLFFSTAPWPAVMCSIVGISALIAFLCYSFDVEGPLRLLPEDADEVERYLQMGPLLRRDTREMRRRLSRRYAALRQRQFRPRPRAWSAALRGLLGGPPAPEGVVFLDAAPSMPVPSAAREGDSFEQGMEALLRDPDFRTEGIELLQAVAALDLMEASAAHDPRRMRALARRLILFARAVGAAPWPDQKQVLLDMQSLGLKDLGRDDPAFLRELGALLDEENAR